MICAGRARVCRRSRKRKSSDADLLSGIRYEDHLWLEKEIKTVANVTSRDLIDFLPIAARVPLRVETQTYPLEEANEALLDLRKGDLRGAKVLVMNSA